MADLKKVRVQLLNTDTGEVIEDVDVLTSASAVTFADGKTLQEKMNSGAFGYDDTEIRQEISNKAPKTHTHAKADVGLGNVTNDAQVKRSEMGKASGVATLDTSGKVPTSQLPSYVDDVLEFASKSAFPTTGEDGKIYVDEATNRTYRWSGSAYVEISSSLALGTTSSTAYAGDKGKKTTDDVNAILNGTTVVPKASDSATVNGKTVAVNVPANAKFTDTTYSVATSSKNGLLSSTDKAKLDKLDTVKFGTSTSTAQEVKLFLKVV